MNTYSMKTLLLITLTLSLIINSECLSVRKHETQYTITYPTFNNNMTVGVSLASGTLYFSGCNININAYTLTNGNFKLVHPQWVATRKFCFSDPDDQVQQLFESATKAVINGQSATFYDSNGNQIFVLTPV